MPKTSLALPLCSSLFPWHTLSWHSSSMVLNWMTYMPSKNTYRVAANPTLSVVLWVVVSCSLVRAWTEAWSIPLQHGVPVPGVDRKAGDCGASQTEDTFGGDSEVAWNRWIAGAVHKQLECWDWWCSVPIRSASSDDSETQQSALPQKSFTSFQSTVDLEVGGRNGDARIHMG